VNIGTAFETDAKTAKRMYPSVGSFDDPAHFAKSAAVRSAAFGNSSHDAVGEQETTAMVAIVSPVGEDAPRFGYGTPSATGNRGNGFD